MARTPNIRVPGRGAGRSIPQGYIIGRTSKGRGPLELINLNAAAGLGLATAQQVASAIAAGGSTGVRTIVQSVSQSYNPTDTTTVSIRFASPPTAGNLMIAVVAFVSGGGAPNPPVGWTQYAAAGPGAGTTFYTEVVYRYAQAGDSATQTVDTNGRAAWALCAWEVSGVIGTIGTDIIAAHMDANANVYPAPGPITTASFNTLANTELLLCAALGNSLTLGSTWGFSAPAGTVDAAHAAVADGGGSDTGCTGMHIAEATAGTPFTTTISVSANSNIVYGIIELKSGGSSGTPGATGATGAQGPIGWGMDGDDGDDGVPIPGNPGSRGATGPQGSIGFGLDGLDGDDGMPIPGNPGNRGATGPQGPIQVSFDGDEGPEGMPLPGNPGSRGATGTQGPIGFGLDGLDGDDGMPLMPWAVSGPIQGTNLWIGGGNARTLLGATTGDLAQFYGSATSAVVRIIGDGQVVQFAADSYGASGAWRFAHANGTYINPTTSIAADTVGNINFLAYEGTNFQQTSRIMAAVDTVTGANNISGYLLFLTRPDGAAAALVERIRIDKNGVITVGASGATKILDQNGGFYGVQASAYSRQVPTTGFAITIGNGISFLILDPAGTLATGTITMPATPLDGHEVTVSSSQIITALTVQANAGQTLDGGISAATFAANSFAGWKYVLAVTTWYRVR